jgi:hypothetical protein
LERRGHGVSFKAKIVVARDAKRLRPDPPKSASAGGLAVWESPCCGVEKLRSERYGMWHNVAIASVLVKHFISDRYEK